MKYLTISSLALTLGACGVVPSLTPEREVSGEARSEGVTTDILVRPRVRPDQLTAALPEDAALEDDGTSVASAPERPANANGSLGTTVASLGNPAEQGLWIKTPLVTAQGPGRVVYAKTGKSVSVTLIPLDGAATAGSQLSLNAMQSLGAPLSDLPTVEVFSET